MNPFFPQVTFFAGDPMQFPVGHYGDGKKPHVCPVCGGKGEVPAGFYDHCNAYSTVVKQPEQCKGCGGSGVIVC